MVKVLGHRGTRGDKRIDENTLEAIEHALASCDGVEIDVSVSADGTAHLVHDVSRRTLLRAFKPSSVYVLDRLLDKPSRKKTAGRRIDEMTDAEIAALRLKKGGKIPTLSEAFALAAKYPDKTINIELKGEKSATAVIRDIEKAVAGGQIKKEQIIISSFDFDAVNDARNLDPSLKFGVIVTGNLCHRAPIYPWNPKSRRHYRACNELTMHDSVTKDIKPDYFISKNARANAKILKRYFPAAQQIVWTRGTRIGKKQRDNITAVIADKPKKMAAFIKKRT